MGSCRMSFDVTRENGQAYWDGIALVAMSWSNKSNVYLLTETIRGSINHGRCGQEKIRGAAGNSLVFWRWGNDWGSLAFTLSQRSGLWCGRSHDPQEFRSKSYNWAPEVGSQKVQILYSTFVDCSGICTLIEQWVCLSDGFLLSLPKNLYFSWVL